MPSLHFTNARIPLQNIVVITDWCISTFEVPIAIGHGAYIIDVCEISQYWVAFDIDSIETLYYKGSHCRKWILITYWNID